MKLRVRIHRQTSRVELPGEEPSVTDLLRHIRETVLPSHRLGAETEFNLSLNGSELLSDTGQTLSSCGIVSGDLICLVLPECAAAGSSSSSSSSSTSSGSSSTSSGSSSTSSGSSSSSSSSRTENQRQQQNRQAAAMTPCQPSSRPAAPAESGAPGPAAPGPAAPGPAAPRWEPMLCGEAEEGQVPLSLELLYHSARPTSPSDAVVAAGNLLMLETGFVPQGCELKPGEMPAGWRSAGGVYRLQYSHPLCGGCRALLVAVSMGPVLVFNATLKVEQTVDTVRKLCLDPCSHVTPRWPGGAAAAAFKDLKKLSRTFKDQLAYPLISAARHAMALPEVLGLAALPPELLLRLLRLLDVVSLLRVASVCRRCGAAAADASLWRHLYRRDFTDSGPGRPRDTDWKELYKRSFKMRSDLRRQTLPCPFPLYPHPVRDIFHPVPLHPPLPGIIGGEYDQRPNLPRGLLPRPRFDHLRPLSDRRGRPADVRRGFI